MPLLDQGDTTFQTSATKAIGWKSARLNTVIAALTAYQDAPGEAELQKLYHSLMTWKRSDPAETLPGNRGSKLIPLLLEVRHAARRNRWAVDTAFPGEPSPINLIARVRDQLDECRRFACTDVGTFAGDINEDLPQKEHDRIYQLGIEQGRSTGRPLIPKHELARGDWDAASLRETYDKVYGSHAGECTSFAKAAAHLLSTNKIAPLMPRIEIVSFQNQRRVPRFNRDGSPLFKKAADGSVTGDQAMENQTVTHVFCLLGRRGALYGHNGALPSASSWNRGTWIVDCWLAALGYDSVFQVSDYPKPGYLQNVFLEMDSFQGAKPIFW